MANKYNIDDLLKVNYPKMQENGAVGIVTCIQKMKLGDSVDIYYTINFEEGLNEGRCLNTTCMQLKEDLFLKVDNIADDETANKIEE
jgi:hypothetical protein